MSDIRRSSAPSTGASWTGGASTGGLGATGGGPRERGSSAALPPGFRMGEFEIERVLGEGGFGIVYLAQDVQLGRPVAIKEYMPSSLAGRQHDLQVTVKTERHRATFELGRRSFINEARLLAQFDHPALVKVLRYWEAQGTAYMAMPFYRARTLKDTLAQLPPYPDEAWLRGLWMPLLEALEHLHAQNCYHRDIAPDNILLPPSGTPILIDFGAARQVIGDATQALTVILKPGFAPIEQYAESGAMRQGPWTDVYALGAVMYHAITGTAPPPAVARLVNDEMRPLAEAAAGRYSPGFLRLIDACLAVHPQARPASVREVRLALEGAPLAPRGITSGGGREDDTVILDAGASVPVPPSIPMPRTRPPRTTGSIPNSQRGTAPVRTEPPPLAAGARESDFAADPRVLAPQASRTPAWLSALAVVLVLGVAGAGAWVAWPRLGGASSDATTVAADWWHRLAPTGAGRSSASQEGDARPGGAPNPSVASSASRHSAPGDVSATADRPGAATQGGEGAGASTVAPVVVLAPQAGLPAGSTQSPAQPPIPPLRPDPLSAAGPSAPTALAGLVGSAIDGPAALLHAHGGADTRWLLQATLERSTVPTGQRLPLKLSTPEDGWVYLLQSQPGSRVVEWLASPRALRASAWPRPGSRDSWAVRGRPGPRRLLLIVSAVPRQFEPAGSRAPERSWDVAQLGDDPLRWPGLPQCPANGEPCDTRYAAVLLDYEVTEAAPRPAPESLAGGPGGEGDRAESRGLSKIVLPRSYGPDEMVPPALAGETVVRRPRPASEAGGTAPVHSGDAAAPAPAPAPAPGDAPKPHAEGASSP